MNSVVFAVIAAAFLASPLDAAAQESAPSNATRPADPLAGKWEGTWLSGGTSRGRGSMEMELDVKGHQVIGQVKSTNDGVAIRECSSEWEKLAGERKSVKVFASYNLGGRCRKVDVVFTIDADGRVMNGTWSSQWPSYGTFSLKKATPTAAGAIGEETGSKRSPGGMK